MVTLLGAAAFFPSVVATAFFRMPKLTPTASRGRAAADTPVVVDASSGFRRRRQNRWLSLLAAEEDPEDGFQLPTT